MLKINQSIIDNLNAAVSLKDLYVFLQGAIALEHSTIPPYLTAELSIKPGTNQDVKQILHTIVIQEMLHMTIACNILNALGGSPEIFKPDFVPSYPSPLPMNINTGLVVGLESLSKTLVETKFMEIEEPETPLVFPLVALEGFQTLAPQFGTIGQFYRMIQEKISELADDTLPGDPGLQVVSDRFSAADLFPVITKTDAIKAIDIIVEQGEGTTTLPVDKDNEFAHFYLFKGIFMGRKLIKDPAVPEGFSYSGAPIVLNEANVYPLKANTKISELPLGSTARDIADQFNTAYSTLLKELHRTFNGEPAFIENTIDTMMEMQTLGKKVVAIPHPTVAGFNTGPTFEFVSV